MVEKIYKNKYMVTCDNCGEGFECETWEEAQEIIKENGWKRKKVEDKFELYCPECKGESQWMQK